MNADRDAKDLAPILLQYRDDLHDFVRRRARGLRRFESESDLFQGVQLRILEQDPHFQYRDSRSVLALLYRIARAHLVDRHRHWRALKRDAGPLLRLSANGDDPFGGDAPSPRTGPATFAERRELLERATRAIDTLPDRERDYLRRMREGEAIQETARALGVSYEAAQKGRHRAWNRFMRAMRALSTGHGDLPPE